MRLDKFVNIAIGDSASSSKPQRLDFDEKKYISVAIKNTSLSAQVLWVGLNTDECNEPLQPGESFVIASRENAFLVGSISMRWDANAGDRIGIITIGTDAGELPNC